VFIVSWAVLQRNLKVLLSILAAAAAAAAAAAGLSASHLGTRVVLQATQLCRMISAASAKVRRQ
jgi:hypothetical protein